MRKEISTLEAQACLESLFQHLGQLLPHASQHQAFRETCLKPPPASLRLNPLIPQPGTLRERLQGQGQQVPWCCQAFVLPAFDQRLGNTLEHAVGALYIQAKAATLAVEVLEPGPGERILDMAAAPGGKTTQIGGRMHNTGLLVVNEPQSKRLPALVGNLERCGLANTVLSKAPGTLLARYFHNYFDRILLDAPCSCDGILRKNAGLLRYWSVEDTRRQAQKQKGLLRAAFHMLRPGGILVYSTCSLSLEENEDVLLGLVEKYRDQVEILPIENIDPAPLPPSLASRYPAEFACIARIWPHLHDTEGACMARIRKRGWTEWSRKVDDGCSWAAAATPYSEVTRVRERLEAQWRFELSCPAGQTLALDHRHLYLRPREGAAFQAHYPFFVRAGMRIARRHNDHYHLTQQAVTMWGTRMQGPCLELKWPQVQALFQGLPVHLEEKTTHKREVVCRFGPWSVCRLLVQEKGRTVQGMVPRELLRRELSRLT